MKATKINATILAAVLAFTAVPTAAQTTPPAAEPNAPKQAPTPKDPDEVARAANIRLKQQARVMLELDRLLNKRAGFGGSFSPAEGEFDLKGEHWDDAARTELVLFLDRLRGRQLEGPKAEFRVSPGYSTTGMSVPYLIRTQNPQNGVQQYYWLEAVRDALRELVTKELTDKPPADADKEIAELKATVETLKDPGETLRATAGRNEEETSSPLYWELSKRKSALEASLVEKKSRRMALQLAVAEETDGQASRKKDDVIAAELRKLVELRQQGVAGAKSLQTNAAASLGDVRAAEAALAEAKVRLFEREEAISKTGKGELIDKLSTELRMTAVDQTQMEIELRTAEERMALVKATEHDSIQAARETVKEYDQERARVNRRLAILLLSKGGW